MIALKGLQAEVAQRRVAVRPSASIASRPWNISALKGGSGGRVAPAAGMGLEDIGDSFGVEAD
jgi:hypothetical protein